MRIFRSKDMRCKTPALMYSIETVLTDPTAVPHVWPSPLPAWGDRQGEAPGAGRLLRSPDSLSRSNRARKPGLRFTDKDEHMYFWFPLLAGLSELTFDPRADVRCRPAPGALLHRPRLQSLCAGA